MTQSVSDSGGFEGSNLTLQLDSNAGSVITFSFEFFQIPDRFIIRYDGNTVLDTGFTSGFRSGTLRLLAGTSDFIHVVVATDDEGTAWNYQVSAQSSLETSPFILTASEPGFTENPATNRYEGSGQIGVGREDGLSQLLRIDGSTSYDEDAFTASGDIYVLSGGVEQLLFSGDFTMPFETGVATSLSDTGGNAPGEMKLGPLDFSVESLVVNNDNVRADVQFVLPDELGSLGLNGLALIFENGTQRLGVNGHVEIPDQDFSFFNYFDVQASDQELSYDVTSQTLKYQGELTLDSFARFIPSSTLTLDLTDENYVAMTPDGVEFVGSIKYERELKEGIWGFKELEIGIDTVEDEVEGSVLVAVPFGRGTIDLGGKLGFVTSPEFQLNTVGITVGDLDKPLPFAPGLFLQSVRGEVNHIAPGDEEPLSVTGAVGLTIGPEAAGLGTIELEATVDSEHMEGEGNVTIVDPEILKAEASFNFDWNEGNISIAGTADLFDGFFTTPFSVTADSNLNFTFNGQAQIELPAVFGWGGGKTIGSGSVRVEFSNDGDLSNDYAAAWGELEFDLFGVSVNKVIGARRYFDGEVDSIGVDSIPGDDNLQSPSPLAGVSVQASAPAAAIPAGQAIVFLTAVWETSQAGAVAVRVHRPDGSIVEEANFAANGIEVVEELASPHSKTVAVQNPAAGDWTLEVVNPAGLGPISYYTQLDSAAPTLTLDSLPALSPAGLLDIGYTANDPDSTAVLSLYADTNGIGFDGVLIATGIVENGGAGSFVWDTSALAPGPYHVYGILTDNVNPDVMAYAPGQVTLSRSADLSVTVTGPAAEVHVGDTVSYTVTVHNDGASVATDVVLSDVLPEGSQLVSASIPFSSQQGGTLEFDLGTMNSGESRQVVLQVRLDAAVVIGENAGATLATAQVLDGEFRLAPAANVESSASIPHVTIAAQGDGALDYYRFTVDQAGDVGIFDIDQTSAGFDSYIRLRDANGIALTSSDDNSGDPGSANVRDSRLFHTFSSAGVYYLSVHRYPGSDTDVVPVGTAYTLHVSLPGEGVGGISATNTATVSSAVYDPVAANNSDFVQDVFESPALPTTDLVVSATSLPGDLTVGDGVSYTVTVRNNGTTSVSGVVLTDFFSGVATLNGTASQGSIAVAGNKITTTLGTLAAGATATVGLSGTLATAGTMYANSQVVGSAVDTDITNNEVAQSATVEVSPGQPADLSVSIDATGRDPSNRQVVRIDVTNAGPGIASGIELLIPMIPGATLFSTSTAQGTYDPSTGVWDVGNMRDDLTRSLTLTFDAAQPFVGLLTAELVAAAEIDPDSTANNHAAGEDDQSATYVAIGAFAVSTGTAAGEPLTGTTGADAIHGLGGNDTLTGHDSTDALFGDDGDDNLAGGAGNDSLIGGIGNDTLHGGVDTDSMVGGAGNDIFAVNTSTDVTVENANEGIDRVRAASGYTLSPNVEHLTLTGTGNTNGVGNVLDNAIVGNGGNNRLSGNEGSDTLTGGAGNDSLIGGIGTDTLTGGAGNDSLNGGDSVDHASGGAGDDTYIVSGTTDVVIENAAGGIDRVRAASSFLLPDHVENLMLIGTDGNNGFGNTLANQLVGNDGANQLRGDEGNDTIDGGAGLDTLRGNAGDDLFILNDADLIIETSGAGVDLVQSAINYTLTNHVDNLTLTGTAATGTGNALANVITGNGQANTLSGDVGNDTLIGLSGKDTLSGGAGNDSLDGGSSPDDMTGGLGDDIYAVGSSADEVFENAGEGFDIVRATSSFVLSENVEVLVLLGTGNTRGTGNRLGNEILGNEGMNLLTGASGSDTLEGGLGNDTLDGGASPDDLTGGLGDDIYAVSTSDDVFENAGEGFDIVRAISGYVLSENIEVLVLLGTGNTRGVGNAGDNEIDGNSGNNKLVGNVGNDVLDGGTGADTLLGGGGNDVLVWDAADLEIRAGSGRGDILRLEGAGQALDLTTINNSLIEDVEVIDITGTGNNDLTLALADVLAISGNTDQLRIDGNVGDDLTVSGGGWTQVADRVIGAHTYHQYTQGAAILLVDLDIAVMI